MVRNDVIVTQQPIQCAPRTITKGIFVRRFIVIGVLLLALTACGESSVADTNTKEEAVVKQYDAHPGTVIESGKSYSAVIKTNLGDVTFDLLADEAPLAVNSFVFLAREGYFNGVLFHRIIPGFMAQGGDPTGLGTGGPGYYFEIEAPQRPYTRGSLAMANKGAGTNGSQFFIVFTDLTAEERLSPDYSLFGQMADGESTLKALEAVPVTESATGERSRPMQEVRISSVAIIES